MKRFYISLVLTSAMSHFSGCSSEMPDMPDSNDELTSVSFNLSFSSLNNKDTRSLAPGYKFSDGSSISVLKCYVYPTSNGSNAEPSQIIDIPISSTNGVIGGNVSVSLPKGTDFDVVFLGTSIPQNDASSKLYYSTTGRSLSVDYSKVVANDEELDCFFTSRANLTSDNVTYSDIVLSRPFAQLNIGTQDYVSYNASNPISNISVSVDKVYSKVNLMDGSLIGDSSTVTLIGSAPSSQIFPVDGFSYLSMNYLLVNLRTLVDVTLTVNHSNAASASKVIPLGQMAVERNCQTNAYSKTLLSDFTLE